ncbi:hypothetical protein [Microbacterium sp. zg-YB36]|uniref:hypothetical protein n=1 Tax=Microbacterium sp. zg-YB36 TaxID=2969407 RepID=UPI00214B27C2|nr:hypothetical protein [Microbacterium sp. zg-YB36]MDL5351197.1 hypothetical protein [Microbacterium sp. zg-YB36]
MSAGDYRKPYNRPADRPLAADFGEDPKFDRARAAWFEWIKYEIAVRLGIVSRSGAPQASVITINETDEMLDRFFDKWDEHFGEETAA